MKQDLFKAYTVVEFASILAGPSVGLFFAELGARVIKIENKTSGGDPTRNWRVPEEIKNDENNSAYYISVNRGKESVFLDLKDSEDYSTAMSWVEQADIVLTNFKKSFAEAHTLRPADLISRFPQLVIGEITGYHHADKPAFDVLLQAETGYISMTGFTDRLAKMPVALIDILAGHQLKEGILAALLHKERTGEGSVVSVSLYDSAIASLANQASNYLVAGHVARPMGSTHPNIAPYGEIFYSMDQVPFVLAVGTEKQWTRLVQWIPYLAQEKWETNAQRLVHREELFELLTTSFSELSWSELSSAFIAQGIPATQIKDLRNVLDDPYVQEKLIYEQGVRNVIWRINP